METAEELLPSIPTDQLNKIARFLEGQGHKELALSIATDPEHKFDLALALGQLPIALELVTPPWPPGTSLSQPNASQTPKTWALCYFFTPPQATVPA
jgi:hypothetical protein